MKRLNQYFEKHKMLKETIKSLMIVHYIIFMTINLTGMSGGSNYSALLFTIIAYPISLIDNLFLLGVFFAILSVIFTFAIQF
jgi:hypothetical protein